MLRGPPFRRVVTLPSQLAKLADLAEGDIVEFDYLGRGVLRIEKV